MINIILSGGLSQVELFDLKFQFDKYYGKLLKGLFDMDVVCLLIVFFFIVFFGFVMKVVVENDGDGEVLQWKLSEEVVGEVFC